MPQTHLHLHPSLDSTASIGQSAEPRHSLYHDMDEFIPRVAPIAVAAIYFGSFSLAPADLPLSRQALFKLSFLHRHFLQPGGLKIVVQRKTAILSGKLTSPLLGTLGKILALQIDGITDVEDRIESNPSENADLSAIQFLFATDQTLRSGVRVATTDQGLVLEGSVTSAAQKTWAEQLAQAVASPVESNLTIDGAAPDQAEPLQTAQLDEESLQALVLFRLQLVPETKSLPLKVKASRSIVTLQGKVGSEALRQRAENVARSTLGLRELRGTVSLKA